jgi:hypothetical protein
MAVTHRPGSLSRACEHPHAEPTGTTTARQLPEGRWQYSTPYHCPDCGAHFTETHTQDLPRQNEG